MHPNASLIAWVNEVARLVSPESIRWLDGSDSEYADLLSHAVKTQRLIPLNPTEHPNSYLHRSHPSDVARTEQRTFICTRTQDEAGPTNHWMAPDEALRMLQGLFSTVMRGRTMYVIPYLMGPPGSPFSRVGVELTDSVYVAINMRIMTRMGKIALEHLGQSSTFVKGLHSVGQFNPKERYICHFPEDQAIYSINSGYGGNALLSKKCFALRVGSWIAHSEGWLAEHMLIMGIEDPKGRVTYVAGAFPSACGKTNLAMLAPPAPFKNYRIWCIGDDIAWLRVGSDGRLYAVNPEAGFFGVAPGTNISTNPNMMQAIRRNTLFTNVGLSPRGTVFWEGLDTPSDPSGYVDWQGKPWQPGREQRAAHPNARFTVSIQQSPVFSSKWEDPQGVPISAIVFGTRRSTLVPLITQALSWTHGVYLGATLESEATAASDTTSPLRHDPMAMLPFCGYHMGDYFSHWLAVGKRMSHPPKIFRVNWFRRDSQGRWLWPGFGENLRVLLWMIERCDGSSEAIKTPIGYLPKPSAFNQNGLSLTQEDWNLLVSVDRDGWLEATKRQEAFFAQLGQRMPQLLLEELQTLRRELAS